MMVERLFRKRRSTSGEGACSRWVAKPPPLFNPGKRFRHTTVASAAQPSGSKLPRHKSASGQDDPSTVHSSRKAGNHLSGKHTYRGEGACSRWVAQPPRFSIPENASAMSPLRLLRSRAGASSLATKAPQAKTTQALCILRARLVITSPENTPTVARELAPAGWRSRPAFQPRKTLQAYHRGVCCAAEREQAPSPQKLVGQWHLTNARVWACRQFPLPPRQPPSKLQASPINLLNGSVDYGRFVANRFE
ncbi:hypothetical protein SAMN04490204_4619 [Pseudomonas thivervalensis]|nr:hypothetical protein SAMN04490204_4619 [Pseudomonas thivervalensis]